ncbi:tetratricopeptide repeat protein [Sphingomonas sp. J315]|uniref:tetratricopeptide repeat protein n=1 Tax=Sphingomonas sp. J315 TaxID=2898433 RepID=UPI0021AE0C47|nr:tetratricopeptide repeat protein [Sphingomonas sp. J315]UUX99610.1 tetratricopeptide repeat protein [Sphingomonas sp. J315]UUX99639.1 tetratricopeptide repeat protein [Sphingomonas sp. J315]
MARGILFGTGVSIAALICGHAEARDGDLRRACAQEARLPTPDDKTGVQFDDMVAERAIELCRRALEAHPRDAAVMANLGRAFSKAGDSKAALSLIERAAAAGSLQAVNTLASMYETGNGVPNDPARAFALAKSGERGAQHLAAGAVGGILSEWHRHAEECRGGDRHLCSCRRPWP